MGLKNLLTTFCLLASVAVTAQETPKSYAVQANAVVRSAPLRLEFTIEKHTGSKAVDSFKIYRKLPQETSWGNPVKTFGASAAGYTYIDSTITDGVAYEYKMVKHFLNAEGYGYMLAGSHIAATEGRGKILFLIDSSKMSVMAAELLIMERDLIGDGWRVVRIYANPTDKVTAVKQKIINAYHLDSNNTHSLLLFGDIPVPYSGLFGGNNSSIPPDGHTPDHDGAWATDLYYGDMDENLWTDVAARNSGQIARNENKNRPRDYKYDQIVLPSTLELSVGRVDLSDLPAFSKNETELLKQYIRKNHDYKHKVTEVSAEGIIDDNFGMMGLEHFAAMGWGNFSTMYPVNKVNAGDFHTDIVNRNIQWGYGCGGGTYTAAGAVINTDYLATYHINTPVFSVVFGSYFGDFDIQNNLLRSCLATPELGLVSFWGGRPLWQLHKMALGQTIGQQATMSQNNDGTYIKRGYDNQIQMNLMGDPTLRLNVVAPVSNLSNAQINNNEDIQISWTASADQVVGYYVYKADNYNSTFVRIHDALITDTTFIDTLPNSAGAVYMVRAMKLETTASGTYYNLSQGVFSEDNISQGAQMLTSTNFFNENNIETMSVYPNPIKDGLVNVTFSSTGNWDVCITDVAGRMVTPVSHISTSATTFNLSKMAKGIYFVKAQKGNEQYIKKVVVQ